MQVDALVESMSRRFNRGQGAYFLGAGVSVPSGMPTWLEMLAPLVSARLRVRLTGEHDLAAAAQYVVNANNGNRRPLVDRLHELLERPAVPNEYHRWIGLTAGADVIWTTNFDELVERALDSRTIVRHDDMSLLRAVGPGEVEVVKLHGCIARSKPDEFVITTGDYEDFDLRRPGLANHLASDLMRRSFLFVGYGYNDPNVRTMLAQQRRIAGSSPPQHWMLLKRPARPSRLFEPWCKDLTRAGIEVVVVEDYTAIEHALKRIAGASRGPTVYVTGSHRGAPPQLAKKLGELLAQRTEAVMLDGQSAGVGHATVEAFRNTCVKHRKPLDRRLRIFLNPYELNPAYAHDPALMPELKRLRSHLLTTARVVVAFPGRMGTQAEVEEAHRVGCSVIRVPSNITASRLLGRIERALA